MITLRPLVLIVLLVSLFGCMTRPFGNPVIQAYRAQYLRDHPNLPPEIENAIWSGNLRKGMDRQQVTASWGAPVTCSWAGDEEICLYREEGNTYVGPHYSYTFQRYNSVRFKDGVVAGWQLH